MGSLKGYLEGAGVATLGRWGHHLGNLSGYSETAKKLPELKLQGPKWAVPATLRCRGPTDHKNRTILMRYNKKQRRIHNTKYMVYDIYIYT